MRSFTILLTSIFLITAMIFVGCGNKQEELTETEQTEYLEKGQDLATETQKVLGSNLMKAINEGGPINALEFCNIQAYPLTDSMATALKAHITRVTDKPRNQANIDNKDELTYIASFKEKLGAGEQVSPDISVMDGKVTGYYPIITNQMCMQCHGSENDQINEETLAKIKELYPNDQATGYGAGELRGIWVVEMDRE
ncbi:c-type heme family protein [Gracilimonas amylolytica]|uniref:c-type heme family protein n=1 Tax=Gracilimonas amylolytica TaxID=1749045 RepID=UPI000CD99F2E|nr:DUF3365 domain-containing protein [Gracilimonas amylolytica]